MFLANRTWVDLRRGLDAEGIDRLDGASITGRSQVKAQRFP